MRTPTLDLNIPLYHFVQRDDREIELYTYDDHLNPGQRSVFMSLEAGQRVMVKDRAGLFMVERISIEKVEGDDVLDIQLELKRE